MAIEKEINRCFGIIEKSDIAEKLIIESKEKSDIDEIDKISILDKMAGDDLQSERNVIEAIQYFADKSKLAGEFVRTYPLHYDKSGLWWFWNKKRFCWEQTDEIDILNLIRAATMCMLSVVKNSERAEIINALKQVARRNKPEPMKETWIQFDKQIIDIESGNKFKASPKYFTTNPIPWKLGRIEDTPTIDKLMQEWVGKDYAKTLIEIFAFSLYRRYFLERIFCFIGGGSNGKSCCLDILIKFLGPENIVTTDLHLLLNSRFETAKLRGKLVCIMGETDFNTLNNTQLIKRMVSGKDPIPIEYKNKGHLDYINYAKIIIATNNLPETSDKTIGFYRRWGLIDFPNEFPEKQDIISTIPEEEFNNLALKSISILMRLLNEREFTNEGNYEERRKRYEDRSNPFDKFWKDNIIEDLDKHISKFDFRKKLNDWCKETRFREMSDRSIIRHMKEKGITDGRVSVDWWENENQTKKMIRAWIGIGWRDAEAAEFKKDVEDNLNKFIPEKEKGITV